MDISNSFGSAFVGGFVSAILYGVTTLQTYVYYLRDSGDALTIKLLVAAVWILDTLHILFLCHALYYYLITNYGVPMSFEYIIWSFPASTLVNIPLVVAVQCFFAHQIYHLCRPRVKLWVTAPIILSVVAEFGFTTETAVLELVNRQTSVATQMTFYGVTPAVTVGALAEIMITISLCILLYDRRSGSALSRTKRLLNTLIIYAVNRCLLILLIAITALVMTMEGQDTWFLGFSFVAGRLYANAFLASLNCRERLRSQGSGTPPIYSSVVSISPTRRSLRGTSKISRVEQGRGDVVDTTKYAASDRTAKLRSEGKV